MQLSGQHSKAMKSATMLYRLGSKEIIWGIPMDTIIVDACDVEKFVSDGWFLHPNEVKSPSVVMETIAIEAEPEKPRRGRPPKVKE